MDPRTLHALAAARSLEVALTALEQRAREALADAAAGSRNGEVSIQSQQFGRRYGLGGYGDPTAAAALGAWAQGGPEPHAAMLGDMLRHLDERYGKLPGAPGQDTLTRIQQAVPAMRPDVAAEIAADLRHMDEVARGKLQMPPDLTAVSGQCPACRMRTLYATSGRMVVCRANCVCSGEGCGCGMPVRVSGVGHIWAAGTLATALAGLGA